jgi:hypothetical protein
MPQLLTRGKAAKVAGFKSERWPASNRNGGRHQLGMVAGFTSEYPAGLHWNLQGATTAL